MALNPVMKSVRPNKSPFFPLTLSCLNPVLVIDDSQTILLTLRPASYILAASDEFKLAVAIFLALLVVPRVELSIFPGESTIALINAIAPLAFVIVLNIESGEFNFAEALRSQDTPVNFTLVDPSVSVVNFGLSFAEVHKFYFLNVSIPQESEDASLRL